MPSVTVKEGYLHKHKAEGPQLLSRFAFKKRYFWLTSETLSYAKTPDWQVGTKAVDVVFLYCVDVLFFHPLNLLNPFASVSAACVAYT